MHVLNDKAVRKAIIGGGKGRVERLKFPQIYCHFIYVAIEM